MPSDAQRKRPRTSVIMPVRNGVEFVGEAIGSALAQLEEADQILVIDDQSTDGTRSVVAAIHDSRIQLLDGPGRGPASARNVGLRAAEGEFIAFLDHDDLWPKSRHEIMITMLIGNPKIQAVFGRMRIRYEPGAVMSPGVAALEGKHVPAVSVGTGLFRSRMLEQVDGFDEDMRFGEDVDYHLRLREAGMRIALCDVDGLIYRRHTNNASNNRLGMQNGMSDVLVRRLARARKHKADAEG